MNDNLYIISIINRKNEEIEMLRKALQENIRSDKHDLKCSYDANGIYPNSDYCNCLKLGKKALEYKYY